MPGTTQRGYSLLEIIIVVGILVFFAVMLSRNADRAESSTEPEALASGLHSWAAAVRAGAAADLRGFDVSAALLQAPTDWIVSRSPKIDVRHPFGGEVLLATTEWRGVPNRGLQYSLTLLPAQPCAIVAQRLAPRAAAMAVGRKTLKTQPTDTVTATAAVGACNAASNSLTWTEL